MKKRLLLSFIILPGSLYFSYGPPIKKIVSSKYLGQLKKECKKNASNERQHDICLKAGKRNLKKCTHTINVITLKSGFPKCLKKEQLALQDCFRNSPPEKCLKS